MEKMDENICFVLVDIHTRTDLFMLGLLCRRRTRSVDNIHRFINRGIYSPALSTFGGVTQIGVGRWCVCVCVCGGGELLQPSHA